MALRVAGLSNSALPSAKELQCKLRQLDEQESQRRVAKRPIILPCISRKGVCFVTWVADETLLLDQKESAVLERKQQQEHLWRHMICKC